MKMSNNLVKINGHSVFLNKVIWFINQSVSKRCDVMYSKVVDQFNWKERKEKKAMK